MLFTSSLKKHKKNVTLHCGEGTFIVNNFSVFSFISDNQISEIYVTLQKVKQFLFNTWSCISDKLSNSFRVINLVTLPFFKNPNFSTWLR